MGSLILAIGNCGPEVLTELSEQEIKRTVKRVIKILWAYLFLYIFIPLYGYL
jgi:hypothetical protein